MDLIKKFKQISKKDVSQAGGKGASLGEMTQAGIPVPRGFVILANAFDRFIEETGLDVEIGAVLDNVNIKEEPNIENASNKIRRMILSKEIPKYIETRILRSYKKLDCKFVAVRSSATSEDSAYAAWAGQLESYLNTTEKTLLENVKKCWASLFTPRAIFYRFKKKLNKDKISVAVVVQKMVDSEKSGIAFSVHPVTQDKNQIIIEAGFGLGEAIVSGSITPDRYIVDKRGFKILDINVNEKTKALYRKVGGGSKWKKLEEGKKQVLTKKEILKLSKLIVKIENHYGFPCDIEWAKEKGKFYIVQSRPITTLQVNQTIPKTEEFIVPRVREYALTPVYWNAILQTSNLVKRNYGKKLSVEYNFFFDGKMNAVIPRQEWNEIGEYISKRLIEKKDYFENIEERTKRAKKKITSFLIRVKKKNLSKSSFHDLIGLIDKIYNLFMEYDAASVFAWFVAGDTLKQKIGAYLEISGEDLDIISLPKEQTFATKMEREIVGFALKGISIKESAKTLAKKYWWMPFSYDGPTVWNEKYFEHRIRECKKNPNEARIKLNEIIKRDKALKQRSKRILKKIRLGRKGKRLVHILRSTSAWTDERKMLEFQLFYWYHQILREFEKRYKFPLKYLKYLFTHELIRLDKDAQLFKKIAKERMNREFMTISMNGKIRIASNEELQKIKEAIGQRLQKGNIQGTVACRGPKTKYTARVKVLHSSKECSKVKRGEILVATMTTPDYVPAMGRALGFITDEGGVTCHAAIAAREMNKPCIIGTKIATQILKDGDKIEVNAENGIIKILGRVK